MMSRKLARDYMHRLIRINLDAVEIMNDGTLDIACRIEIAGIGTLYPSCDRNHARVVTNIAATMCREGKDHEPGILRTVMGEVCRRDGIGGSASRWWERTPRQESTAALVAVRAFTGVEEMKSLLDQFDKWRDLFLERVLTDDELAEGRRVSAKIKELLTAAGVEGP